ncbi:hypothetical protein HAV21_17620 [Paenarthrobacter sp. MSM-2-10-13]|uniref:hypothetical protein n=1 Tax=Paenarthrobacter sp. MSM-2-10-13 TaxID=2717318 RepID=UPI00142183E0|nr:hypothetical protein [Paenarthrobacter sp. MSM-2-10-13]NHW48688.1 hypothetical protein [Paenarthrobacter sp. MSM-2-10-13]
MTPRLVWRKVFKNLCADLETLPNATVQLEEQPGSGTQGLRIHVTQMNHNHGQHSFVGLYDLNGFWHYDHFLWKDGAWAPETMAAAVDTLTGPPYGPVPIAAPSDCVFQNIKWNHLLYY